MFSNVLKKLQVIEYSGGDLLSISVTNLVFKVKMKYSNHSVIKAIERVPTANIFYLFFNLQDDWHAIRALRHRSV